MYKTPTTQRALRLLKLAFPFVALGYILFVSSQSWQSVSNTINGLFQENALYLFLIVLLWPANLFFESLKWRTLFQKVSLPNAIKGVLMGSVTAFVSPNRLGDFIGRVQVVSSDDRLPATLATFLSGAVQGCITLFFGIIGLLLFSPDTFGKFELNSSAVFCFGIGISGFLVFRKVLIRTTKSFFEKTFVSIKSLEVGQGIKAFTWGVLRYGVFSLELSLSLVYFGYEGDIGLLLAGIASLYLLQSVVPFTAFGELGSRELIAVWLLGPSMAEPWLAAAATILVWMVNVAIPALLGSQLFFRSELRKLYSR